MRRSGAPRRSTLLGLGSILALAAMSVEDVRAAATAVSLDRAAAERHERRRAAKAGQLALPLPGTPDTERPLTRLAALGVSLGARVMIRVFKAESELEVWVERNGAYVPFATYPVCYWSGGLGPKLREGDRQAPEGFYTITSHQLHYGGRWRRSLDIGYPNVFDRVNGRSGSAILVHGGCDSSGCFAMTNAVNAELYDLVSAALRRARHVPVHVFPFRMTKANLAAHGAGPWKDFWGDLRQGYESFERTRLPPRVTVCGRRYRIEDAPRGEPDARAVEICPEDIYMTLESVQQTARAEAARLKAAQAEAGRPAVRCSMARPSCRRWVALRERKAAGAVAMARARSL